MAKNWDSDLYLYAKHWYSSPCDDVRADLKKIIAKRCALYEGTVSDNDICQVLIGLVTPHLMSRDTQVVDFVMRLNPDKWENKQLQRKDFFSMLVHACLSVLSCAKVRENDGKVLIELDAPDYELFQPSPTTTCESFHMFWPDDPIPQVLVVQDIHREVVRLEMEVLKKKEEDFEEIPPFCDSCKGDKE